MLIRSDLLTPLRSWFSEEGSKLNFGYVRKRKKTSSHYLNTCNVLSLFSDFMTPGSENTLMVILPLVKCKTTVLIVDCLA